ncbi:MAG: biotin-dependent carboxyltransferase family protein [Fimbriimonadaceae bacterium]|nr:biotin-dependent carboxyltransferase family protein [Fimbriimonadaceae bacterium]
MSLRVFSISGAATLQGERRFGRRHFGVPYGGPWDRESHLLANALLGNSLSELALELPMYGGVFIAEETIRVALVGGNGPVSVNGTTASSNSTFTLHKGDRLEIDAYSEGSIAYLAASGGWSGDPAANVKRNDILVSNERTVQGNATAQHLSRPPQSLATGKIRATHGPQFDTGLWTEDPMSVLAERNRVGTRLSGKPSIGFQEITSEPACIGAIQVTPKGEWIVIGPDGPTIGGYPKVGVVIEADLARVSQLRENQSLSFQLLTAEEALLESERQQNETNSLASLIRTSAQRP